jgi:hypothetical protein
MKHYTQQDIQAIRASFAIEAGNMTSCEGEFQQLMSSMSDEDLIGWHVIQQACDEAGEDLWNRNAGDYTDNGM